MLRRRIKLWIVTDLDQTPGQFHTEESALETLQARLTDRFGFYKPVVSMATNMLCFGQPIETPRYRKAFVLDVDLDEWAGSFHSKLSARTVIRVFLDEIIPHYRPIVTNTSVYAREVLLDYTYQGSK